MRLNFSGVGEDDIREGVRRIGKVVARAGRALRDADRRGAGAGRGAGAAPTSARRRRVAERAAAARGAAQ